MIGLTPVFTSQHRCETMSAVPSAPHTSNRAARAVRAALFAVVCVGVGATLHGAAGGCHATWSAIGFGLPAIWFTAWFGLAQERSWSALTIGLGVAQVGLHLLLTYFEAGAAAAHATAPAVVAAAPMQGMPGMAIPQPNPYAATLTMITAHALAVVVCGWWLGQGERDFFALCRAVGALVATPVHRLAEAIAALAGIARSGAYVVPRVHRTAQDDGARQRPTPLLTALTFRGPPVVA